MKRHGNLFSMIVSRDNLILAYEHAKRHKKWRRAVHTFEKHKEERINELHDSLVLHTFHTSKYKTKKIYEPKERLIYVLPFYPDRIVQHAIMNVLEPIWDNLLIYDCYSCRKGKGQHKASQRCIVNCKKYEFCMQFDIHKFYPSINHKILKNIIRKKIKDKNVLWLLDDIIDSIDGECNVPIGNYLSQWFGNIYMNELDMYVKHVLKIKTYERYCDDFLIFGNDKELLKRAGDLIERFIKEKLSLSLSKKSLFHTYQGVDFLGYRHFSSGKILVRKRTAKRMKKKIRTNKYEFLTCRKQAYKIRSTVGSIKGWLCHANTYNLQVAIKLKELSDMVGYPKFLNTKEDYEYVRNNFPKNEWEKDFKALLDGEKDWFNVGETDNGIIDDTHKVIKDEQTGKTYQYELQVNPNCKMHRIGYTREEVEKALNE